MWALHHLAAAKPADALAWHRELLVDTAVRMVSTADERVWPAAAPAACRLVVAVEGKVVPDWNYIERKSPGGCLVSMADKRVWPATAPTAWSLVICWMSVALCNLTVVQLRHCCPLSNPRAVQTAGDAHARPEGGRPDPLHACRMAAALHDPQQQFCDRPR